MQELIGNYQSDKIYHIFLGLFASLIPFREISTIFFILFILFYFSALKELKLKNKIIKEWVILSIPLILHLLFLWNNDNIIQPLKQTEKHLAFFILPLIILFQTRRVDIKTILKSFSVFFSLILFFGIFSFIITNLEKFNQYLSGEMTWSMGYSIANSLNAHAPALNMHISFLCFINLYLFFDSININTTKTKIIFRAFLMFISLMSLLIINTRLALSVFILFSPIYIFSIRLKNAKYIKSLLLFSSVITLVVFLKIFPNTMTKFTEKTFNNLEMLGRLDELDSPEKQVYGSLVTRATVWNITFNIAVENIIYGLGTSKSYPILFDKYQDLNQSFLLKHKYKVHNQFLDFFLKFGFLGPLLLVLFFINILRLYISVKEPYILYFFILFLSANCVDDFLIRYDGIVFSSFWICIFCKNHLDTK